MEFHKIKGLEHINSIDDFFDTIKDETQRKSVRQFAEQFGVRGNEQLEGMFILTYMNLSSLRGMSETETRFLHDIVDVTEGATGALQGSLESLINNKLYECKEVATGLTDRTNNVLQKFIDTFTNLAVFLDESEKGMQKRYDLRMDATDKAIDTMHAHRMQIAESRVEELVASLAAKVVPPILEKSISAHMDRVYNNHKRNQRELLDLWNMKKAKRDFSIWFCAMTCAGMLVLAMSKFFH